MTPGSAGSTPRAMAGSVSVTADPEDALVVMASPTKEGCKEDGEDLSHIGRQEQADRFLDIGEDLTSFFTATIMAAKLSSG